MNVQLKRVTCYCNGVAGAGVSSWNALSAVPVKTITPLETNNLHHFDIQP